MIPTGGESLCILCQAETLGFLDRPVKVERAIVPRILGITVVVGIIHPIIGGLSLGLQKIELAPVDRLRDALTYSMAGVARSRHP